MDENVYLPLSEDGWEWETDTGAEYGPGEPDGADGSQSRRDCGSAERGTDGESDMSAAWDMSGGDPGGAGASDAPGAASGQAADGQLPGTARSNTAEASGSELRSPVSGTEDGPHARFGGKLPAPGASAGTQEAAPRFAPPVPGAMSVYGAAVPPGASAPGAGSALARMPLGSQTSEGTQALFGTQVPALAQAPYGAAAPQAALLAAQEARQRRQRDFVDFFRSRPDVQARDIPEQVYRQVQQGVPLLTAYTAWENRSLRARLAAQRQNEMNRGRAVSAAASSGRSTASDQWARAWDSD